MNTALVLIVTLNALTFIFMLVGMHANRQRLKNKDAIIKIVEQRSAEYQRQIREMIKSGYITQEKYEELFYSEVNKTFKRLWNETFKSNHQ